jgi:WD40 repeat protein
LERLQDEWRQKTYAYAAAVNEFLVKGLRDGWDTAGEEPEDPGREHLAATVVDALRDANRTGDLEGLKERWPPAHRPFVKLLEKNGQSIPTVCLLDDGTILARIGAPYERGRVLELSGTRWREVPDVQHFGRSPNRRYFAIAATEGVRITDGWRGPEVAVCPWPIGLEGMPDGYTVAPLEAPPTPTRLVPFPDGRRVLLVSDSGIFVLSPDSARRLLPSVDELREHFDWLRSEHPDDDLSLDLDMGHGAVSPDGRWIAVGSQDSSHMVFDEDLNAAARVGTQSEYPHHALFSADGSMIAFNSCHFYNGVTVGVPTRLLPGLETGDYEPNEETPILEGGARIYAGASRNDEFVVGDAYGYVRAFDTSGALRWQHFLGSSIGDLDISRDGRTMAVSSYAGFLSLVELDAGRRAAYQIGTGEHFELRRWVIWKGEEPLVW